MAKNNFQNMNTMIGQDASFSGELVLGEGLIVYGKIHGNIKTQGAVRVSKTGRVEGNIICSDIHISGYVQGNVVVENRAVLGEASQLKGDLTYKSIIIEEGAQFQGQCIILGAGDDAAAEYPSVANNVDELIHYNE